MSKAFFYRPHRVAAATAESTAAGHDPAYVGNDHMGVVWKSAGGSTAVGLTLDLGSAQTVDTALFFGCTGASNAWTMTVRSADDAAMTVNAATHVLNGPFLAGATMPTHGRGVGYWEGNVGLTPRRYWRFDLGNLSNAQVTIARAALGMRNQLNRNFAFGGGWGLRDLGRTEFSPDAVLLRRRGPKLRTLGLTFPHVHKDEAETIVQPLVDEAGGQEPIVLVTDPEAHALRQRRSWLGPLIGDLGTVWRTANGWEWRANLIDLVPIPKAS